MKEIPGFKLQKGQILCATKLALLFEKKIAYGICICKYKFFQCIKVGN